MMLDPRQSLQLAFAHLEAFSVPGVGTFRRARYSAVIDHQSGTIQPPGERFILEKGESLVDRLTDFYFRHFHLSIGKAGELVQSVAAFLQLELQQGGAVAVPGIGKIQRSGASGFVLVPESGLHAHSDNFFGLATLPYTLNTSSGVTQVEKADAARRESALRSVQVEPAPKPVRRSGTRLRGVVVTLLLLVMAVSGAGIIWQDEFQGWLKQAGWVGGTQTGDTLLPPGPESAVVDLTQLDTHDTEQPIAAAHKEGQLAEQAKHPKSEIASPAVAPTSKPAPPSASIKSKPARPAPEVKAQPQPAALPSLGSADLADFDGIGEYAKSGTFYLVVGARKDAAGAQETARKITQNGIKARILVPRQPGPHYKVFVHADRTKSKVIEKMVAWKDKFPEKSWIFWMGM
jgi:hypothetical protein